jgi:hypothetical protein
LKVDLVSAAISPTKIIPSDIDESSLNQAVNNTPSLLFAKADLLGN